MEILEQRKKESENPKQNHVPLHSLPNKPTNQPTNTPITSTTTVARKIVLSTANQRTLALAAFPSITGITLFPVGTHELIPSSPHSLCLLISLSLSLSAPSICSRTGERKRKKRLKAAGKSTRASVASIRAALHTLPSKRSRVVTSGGPQYEAKGCVYGKQPPSEEVRKLESEKRESKESKEKREKREKRKKRGKVETFVPLRLFSGSFLLGVGKRVALARRWPDGGFPRRSKSFTTVTELLSLTRLASALRGFDVLRDPVRAACSGGKGVRPRATGPRERKISGRINNQDACTPELDLSFIHFLSRSFSLCVPNFARVLFAFFIDIKISFCSAGFEKLLLSSASSSFKTGGLLRSLAELPEHISCSGAPRIGYRPACCCLSAAGFGPSLCTALADQLSHLEPASWDSALAARGVVLIVLIVLRKDR